MAPAADHVPPAVTSARVTTEPMHMEVSPVIGPGCPVTVTAKVETQPYGLVYVIVTTPGATPVMIPVEIPAEATAGLLLIHVPAPAAFVSVMEVPTQTTAGPNTGATGLTVRTVVAVAAVPQASVAVTV